MRRRDKKNGKFTKINVCLRQKEAKERKKKRGKKWKRRVLEARGGGPKGDIRALL